MSENLPPQDEASPTKDGSAPEDGAFKLMPIARVTAKFGIKGEVKISAADPDVVQPGLTVYVRAPNRRLRRYLVLATRRQHKTIVARLEGVDDEGAAGALRGADLLTTPEQLPPLPPGSFRDAELIGMHVIDASLGGLGQVRAIRHYPSCEMLVVGESALLVPLLHAYGVQVDSAARQIFTHLPAGFLDLK